MHRTVGNDIIVDTLGAGKAVDDTSFHLDCHLQIGHPLGVINLSLRASMWDTCFA